MSQFPRASARKLAQKVLKAKTKRGKIRILKNAAKQFNPTTKNGWYENLMKLAIGLHTDRPAFGIFIKGNGKLPYWSFSELPEFTCPGAGDCLKFCYSFKAWQYPAAFCRQLQNTILMRNDRNVIATAFNNLKPEKGQSEIIVRLYVDGDFSSVAVFAFWQKLLIQKPEVAAYGYSKSWEIITKYANMGGNFADNYTLNLSSGSKYGEAKKAEMVNLPITRGEFVAVKTATNHGKSVKRYQQKPYHTDVRQSARESLKVANPFSCPGSCGDCGIRKPFCADKTKPMLIAIGVH